MAPNEHLLDNFSASKETQALATEILRLAHVKTGPGSGRELPELRGGLPAASILIACQRLNNTEVNRKAAQGASCLSAREFKKVYDTVQAILEENERAKNLTYEKLHVQYKSGITFDSLKEFIAEVEPEAILRSGQGSENNLTRCAVYFWVLNCIKPNSLPETEILAQQYDLSVKKFISTLDALNEHCKPSRKKILAHFKASARRSPRKSFSPSKVAIPSDEPTEGTPNRRSFRTTSSLYGTNNSPTKSPLPPPWKKGPIRELPTKDSLTKQTNGEHRKSITKVPDEPLQTPSKRRKTYPAQPGSTSAFLAAVGTQDSAVHTPKKSPTVIKVSSPLKRSHAVAISTDVPSESDESESGDLFPRGRYRPVYVEDRQWTARDPLVASIWKRAEKLRARKDGLRSPARRRNTTAIR